MTNYLAYLDESGGHGFDFSTGGTSTHFVICAILVNADINEEIKRSFEQIKNQYFPISELKSSKIGKNDNLRLKIINDLKPLDFRYYILAVDKRQILPNTGLQYKEVFYKFLYGIIYNNLFRTIRNISVIADQMISDDFLEGFKIYIQKNHTVDLFNQNAFDFKNSNDAILLQLADFIGGTLNRYYSGKSSLNITEFLSEKQITEIIWPEKYKPYTVDESEIIDEFKDVISDLAILRIDAYLGKNENSSDPIIKKRVFFLNYLKAIFQYNNKTKFIYTVEIINHLEKLTGDKIKEQYFRQQIVGPLRTEGVLISSNTNGYKIPSSQADIYSFFNLSSRIIHPMLKRLKVSQEALMQATNGRLNILENPEYSFLKKLLE